MEIRVKIRKGTLKANTVDAVRRKVQQNFRGVSPWSAGSFGSGMANRDNVILYTIEKRRPKKKQAPRATYTGVKGLPVRKTAVVEEGHAIAHYYVVPKALLDSSGLKVIQGARTFEIYER